MGDRRAGEMSALRSVVSFGGRYSSVAFKQGDCKMWKAGGPVGCICVLVCGTCEVAQLADS